MHLSKKSSLEPTRLYMFLSFPPLLLARLCFSYVFMQVFVLKAKRLETKTSDDTALYAVWGFKYPQKVVISAELSAALKGFTSRWEKTAKTKEVRGCRSQTRSPPVASASPLVPNKEWWQAGGSPSAPGQERLDALCWGRRLPSDQPSVRRSELQAAFGCNRSSVSVDDFICIFPFLKSIDFKNGFLPF